MFPTAYAAGGPKPIVDPKFFAQMFSMPFRFGLRLLCWKPKLNRERPLPLLQTQKAPALSGAFHAESN
jgi:hypothetical protein